MNKALLCVLLLAIFQLPLAVFAEIRYEKDDLKPQSVFAGQIVNYQVRLYSVNGWSKIKISDIKASCGCTKTILNEQIIGSNTGGSRLLKIEVKTDRRLDEVSEFVLVNYSENGVNKSIAVPFTVNVKPGFSFENDDQVVLGNLDMQGEFRLASVQQNKDIDLSKTTVKTPSWLNATLFKNGDKAILKCNWHLLQSKSFGNLSGTIEIYPRLNSGEALGTVSIFVNAYRNGPVDISPRQIFQYGSPNQKVESALTLNMPKDIRVREVKSSNPQVKIFPIKGNQMRVAFSSPKVGKVTDGEIYITFSSSSVDEMIYVVPYLVYF